MTTLIPTTAQLIVFVEDNQLNIFEHYNEQNDDVLHDLMDAETYVSDNYNQLVEDWQKEQPCSLTTDEIKVIYDRAFEKLKTLRGTAEYFDYAIMVCQRLLNYKLSKINSKYSA